MLSQTIDRALDPLSLRFGGAGVSSVAAHFASVKLREVPQSSGAKSRGRGRPVFGPQTEHTRLQRTFHCLRRSSADGRRFHCGLQTNRYLRDRRVDALLRQARTISPISTSLIDAVAVRGFRPDLRARHQSHRRFDKITSEGNGALLW
jgi:hypothetical protein